MYITFHTHMHISQRNIYTNNYITYHIHLYITCHTRIHIPHNVYIHKNYTYHIHIYVTYHAQTHLPHHNIYIYENITYHTHVHHSQYKHAYPSSQHTHTIYMTYHIHPHTHAYKVYDVSHTPTHTCIFLTTTYAYTRISGVTYTCTLPVIPSHRHVHIFLATRTWTAVDATAAGTPPRIFRI